MSISITPFKIESYDAVLELWRQSESIGLSGADSRENIKVYLDRNPGMSFIAMAANGKVVGTVLGGHDGRRGYIHHLIVHQNFRRQGLASRLVNKCILEFKKIGIQKSHIFIYNDNTSGIEFWKSIGWIFRSDISIMSKDVN